MQKTKATRFNVKGIIFGFLLSACLLLGSCASASLSDSSNDQEQKEQPKTSISQDTTLSYEDIPEYSGEPYVEINDGLPELSEEVLTEDSFEEYGPLDKHGRCSYAEASLSIDTQPAPSEERGDISSVHPSGWMSGQGWERCHLIGWQLCGENANPNNLVTGTHYMNVSGMLPFENKVDDYLEETGNHVAYKVTPVYKGKDMICYGVQMEAQSVEDDGRGISFNVFCYNIKPGCQIDYKTGEVVTTDSDLAASNAYSRVYILNTSSMKIHYPSCSSVDTMAEHNKKRVTSSIDALKGQGYTPCGNCLN